jgi:cytochrome b561
MAGTEVRYSKTAIWLHWVAALVMLFMLFLSEDLIQMPRGASMAGWEPTAHASWGFMVLLLGIARLLWRMGHPPPALPPTTSGWQATASHVTHGALYALMIIIPIFGLLALVPYGAQRLDVDKVVFFNLFPLAFMPNLGEWTMGAHEILGKVAQVLVILHILAALKHQFWDKDQIFSRMRPY